MLYFFASFLFALSAVIHKIHEVDELTKLLNWRHSPIDKCVDNWILYYDASVLFMDSQSVSYVLVSRHFIQTVW